MTEFSPLIDNPPLEGEEARKLLESILERAKSALNEAILVFDLDSTLLNNSPRQAKIMRHYAEEHGVEALQGVQGEHWSGWDPRIPMRRMGLSDGEIDKHYQPFREYWWERFFASDYCVDDVPITGAKAYVDSVVGLGARVFYVTGRHETMRRGTLECFERHALPLPNDDSIQLLMKPTQGEHDDAYKQRAYRALRTAGRVIGAFDNEPTHINGYLEAFPEAQSVHLATDHSLREIRVHPSIPSIRDFSAWLER